METPIELAEKIILTNIFGYAGEVNEKIIATYNVDGCLGVDEFYIAKNVEDERKVIIGNPLLNKINNSKEELSKLMKQFPVLLEETPSTGVPNFICKIETQPGKKVNIKYINISQILKVEVKTTIDRLLKSGYLEISSS